MISILNPPEIEVREIITLIISLCKTNNAMDAQNSKYLI